MYQRLDFGLDAKAYIRLQLSRRATLWKNLCDLPLEMGRVYGFLPAAITMKSLLHFAWNLHSREDLEAGKVDYTYREEDRKVIAEFLQKSEKRLAVFYGDTISSSDKARHYDDGVTTYYNTLLYPNNYSSEIPQRIEVYYVVRAGVTRDELEYALDNAVERMPFMACLTSLPDDILLPLDKQFDRNILRSLADRTETIFVSAYGNDANLIWTRT